MIRALVWLAIAAVVAAAAAWIAGLPGAVTVALPGWEIRLGVPAAAGLVGLVAAVAVVVVAAVAAVGRWPAEMARRALWRRRDQAEAALARGLVAVAAGDARTAQKEARRAQGLAGRDAPLALLLQAQAAELAKDDAGAERAFALMLERPETEPLGQRGLYALAMRRGDPEAALVHAKRALALAPRTAWAADAIFALETGAGRWSEAERALEAAQGARAVDGGLARRRRAVLLTAEAIEAEDAGEDARARDRAMAALALSPGLTPAAVLAARALQREGRAWKAADILETAWSQAPHPDIAAVYAGLKPDESADARARRLEGLAALKPGHRESRLLHAAEEARRGRYDVAARILAPAAESFPTARVAALMAEIALGRGDGGAARAWTARAALAPRDAEWTCTACGAGTTRWAPLCPSCERFDTLDWAARGERTLEPMPPIPAPEPDAPAPAEAGESAQAERPAETPVAEPAQATAIPPPPAPVPTDMTGRPLAPRGPQQREAGGKGPAGNPETEVFRGFRQPDDPGAGAADDSPPDERAHRNGL